MTLQYQSTVSARLIAGNDKKYEMATGFYFDYDPQDFYVWTPPSKALSIHINLTVVKRLEQECMRAAHISPPRELAGVLLGYSITSPAPASFIEDFALLADYSKRDELALRPAQSLAQSLGKLARRAQLQQKPVGFFRWQRGGWLSLTDRDLEAANRFFSDPQDIVLLIRSSEARANEGAFFWREAGSIHSKDSVFEFPFDAGKLSREHAVQPKPRLASSRSSAPKIEAKAQEHSEQKVKPKIEKKVVKPLPPLAELRQPVRWAGLIPTVAMAMILTGTGVVALGNVRATSARSEPAAPDSGYETPLGLRITTNAQGFMIQWNRNSAAIRAAQHGLVRIVDGPDTRVAEFNGQQLRDRYVAYEPRTKDVSIEVEVLAKDGTITTESMRFLVAAHSE